MVRQACMILSTLASLSPFTLIKSYNVEQLMDALSEAFSKPFQLCSILHLSVFEYLPH